MGRDKNVDKKEIYKPTIKQVPDVDLTHELWLLKNTRFVLEKKIWFAVEKTIRDIYNDINEIQKEEVSDRTKQ